MQKTVKKDKKMSGKTPIYDVPEVPGRSHQKKSENQCHKGKEVNCRHQSIGLRIE